MLRILDDRGTEYGERIDQHDYQLTVTYQN